jgi:RHS repeat-associated protein
MFGVSAPIEEITASGTVQYLSSTPSGVQAAFTGGTSPALLELASYSIYGLQTLKSGTGVSPFKFEGSYNDSAIGSNLDYLINRYYDPSTDQFLSVDPDVAETDQPYAFTGDDPLNATDPTGNIVQNCGDECPPGVPTTGPTPPPGSVPVIPIAPPGSGATQLNDTTVAIAHQPSGDDSTENVAAQDYGEFAPADNPGYQRAMYQVNGMLNGYFNFPQNSTGGGWVILVDAGVIFVCAAGGEGVCIAAGVADAAAHGYSDVEHHCSASDTTIDVGLSLLSVGYGKLAELGKPALEGANGSIKLMYGATTTAPSAAGVVADPCE